MKILVLGGGGREHAIVKSLRRSSASAEILCAPGNAGIARDARCLPISADTPEGIERLVAAALKERPDLTVVGPEAPLVLGVAERLEAEGLRVFGPRSAAARLEGSKCFAKEFLARHGIPTADFRIFDEPREARAYVERAAVPVVVKADGLAAGKGVFVARDRADALRAVEAILVERRFGEAGRRIVVEECLFGSEISFFAVLDGESFVVLETAQDYKPLEDGDRGPNTGGMGSYSPYLALEDPKAAAVLEQVVRPTARGLAKDGIAYRGVLYFGLMLTASGPRVLEFNVRLGDPEAQALLPRLETSFVELAERTLEGRLEGWRLSWDRRPSVTVVAASAGYPGRPETGAPISGLDRGSDPEVLVFHSGTRLREDGAVVTAGGRVLAVTALGEDRARAREKAYAALGRISFSGMRFRRDIGAEGR